MPAITFPVSSAPGETPQAGSGRLINCYAVKTDQGSRSPLKWLRSAGLLEALDITGHVHCRGFIFVGSTLIVVLNERVYAVTLAGVTFSATNLGALPGTDTVTIARNQAGTPDIAVVTNGDTFNLFTNSAPTSFADGDWPSMTSVAPANGYIAGLTGSGVLWFTNLNNVGVDAQAFIPTQMEGRRVVYHRGELIAFGADRMKFYEETGESPVPFRYKRVEVPRGICGVHAVAGFEEGWIGDLYWVGNDNILYRLNGYTPEPVSNDDMSRAIANAADRSLIELSVYMDGKNAMLAITSPGEWTWEYNATTGQPHERQSYGRSDWRARRSVKAFDRWIVGDDTTGKLAAVDPSYRYEYGGALIQHMESGDNASFASRLSVPDLYFDFVAGQGVASGADPIETDPKVMISWSLDGGATWGNEVTRSLGAQGKFNQLVHVNSRFTTKAKGFRVRLRVSDPVNATFMGGTFPKVEARAA